MVRTILIGFGLTMLIFGLVDLFQTRPHFVSSNPEPGKSLYAPPTAVTVTFSDELTPESSISVVPTVSLKPSGEQSYSGGGKVNTTSAIDIHGPEKRSLKAILQLELPNGLYRVNWNVVAAKNGAQRYGSFYFSAGMAVPDHILREGTNSLEEKDVEYIRDWRASALGGGVIFVLLGLIWKHFPRRS
jgi:methionine-rich copper-binding protein CopC